MVFCIGRRMGMFPWLCGRHNKQKIIRSSYLNTYETLHDEDSCVNHSMDEMDMSKIRKRHGNCDVKRSNRVEKHMVNENDTESANDSTYDLHDEHCSTYMHPEEDLYDAEDIDGFECASEQTELNCTFSESKYKGNKYETDNNINNHRCHIVNKNASKSQRHKKEHSFHGKNGVANETSASAKKAQILEKYKTRIYQNESKSKNISIESEIGTVCNNALSSTKTNCMLTKTHTSNRFSEYSPEESESEISFIMDLYDKTSLNNDLKQKMSKYLSLLEKRSKEELNHNA
ncbi:hypothetical protein M896_080330 [Ordospora colligata OC4]|uniref:Uncharacterized protein n=1 Tax=Ordospora colligata OC4 TaxID=1354746 RepID=A0A0B2UJB4_9MICR|nr:uncharacterized protein M896_080330 [Ordospora colligata OC4]KHN69299.1 hypothetical protein M896_080330 [Ordospora colligata OC4]TBU15115.1 hypothetical protein CWI41_080340 [Ordospora colligata]TBU15166.1 hypothetical protein CWI40_080340 [Ordospora colligata]